MTHRLDRYISAPEPREPSPAAMLAAQVIQALVMERGSTITQRAIGEVIDAAVEDERRALADVTQSAAWLKGRLRMVRDAAEAVVEMLWDEESGEFSPGDCAKLDALAEAVERSKWQP